MAGGTFRPDTALTLLQKWRLCRFRGSSDEGLARPVVSPEAKATGLWKPISRKKGPARICPQCLVRGWLQPRSSTASGSGGSRGQWLGRPFNYAPLNRSTEWCVLMAITPWTKDIPLEEALEI